MEHFKLESFNNFLKHQKNNKISFKQYTHEEFVKLIQPYICELCRRLFNPTKEELKNIDILPRLKYVGFLDANVVAL